MQWASVAPRNRGAAGIRSQGHSGLQRLEQAAGQRPPCPALPFRQQARSANPILCSCRPPWGTCRPGICQEQWTAAAQHAHPAHTHSSGSSTKHWRMQTTSKHRLHARAFVTPYCMLAVLRWPTADIHSSVFPATHLCGGVKGDVLSPLPDVVVDFRHVRLLHKSELHPRRPVIEGWVCLWPPAEAHPSKCLTTPRRGGLWAAAGGAGAAPPLAVTRAQWWWLAAAGSITQSVQLLCCVCVPAVSLLAGSCAS